MTAKTPVYQLEYIVEGEPLREARLALENNAKSIEAALVLGGIAPPASQDLATLSGRVTALEADTASTEVAYVTNVSIAYNDVAAGWTGLRYWRNGNVVTVSGAFRFVNAAANLTVVATLPAGFRPPGTIQTTSPNFTILTNGQIRLNGTAATNSVWALGACYGVL
jgi:diphthamide biosynthesis methyltransferase